MFLSKVGKFYHLFYFDETSKRRKVSTKSVLKSDALKFLRDFKQHEHERKVKLSRQLLSEFKEDFLTHSKTIHTPKTHDGVRIAFGQFIRIIGDAPMHKITVRQIEHFLAVKREEASEWTARNNYISLASAFETAKRWNCIESNPFRSVEKPKMREVQPAFFSKDDFRHLIHFVDDVDWRELFITAVATGMRLSELTALQWTDVDFVHKLIHVRNSDSFTTKSKKNRVVPMTEQLFLLLRERNERAATALVFHEKGRRLTKDEVSKAFKKYVRKACLSDKLHFHSLRHTFASWLVQDGASLYEVQKLLGHSTSKTTEIYSHLQPEQLHSTVNRILVPTTAGEVSLN
jgi:site-specific recombinase XerD